MDLSFFTRRYVDRSKNTGFQFEFFCDRCNKGYLTPFRIHALGVVTSIWDATDWNKEKEKDFDFDTLKKDVSRLFFKGKAWIEAYTNAVEEAQKHFRHCDRCLKWVCPKSCFNPRANLCQGCAPLTEAEKAALKAEERRRETGGKSAEPVDAPRVCPHCGKSNPMATFCADCGQKIAQDIFCPGCGCKWSTEKRMKFCPRCGEEMPQFVPKAEKPKVVQSEGDKPKAPSSERPAQKSSDRTFDKSGDKTMETFADLSNEVRKVAEEYKSFAEDIFGLKPRPTTRPSTAPTQKKAQPSDNLSQSSDAAHKPETAQQSGKPAQSSTKAAPEVLEGEDDYEASEEHSADHGKVTLSGKGKSRTVKAKKPQTRKITKISKAKKTTVQKKKTAPPAKKKVTKSNESKGQSKPKAKKKPKPRS